MTPAAKTIRSIPNVSGLLYKFLDGNLGMMEIISVETDFDVIQHLFSSFQQESVIFEDEIFLKYF